MEQQITLETLHQRMDSLQELLMNVLDLLSKEKKKQLKEKEEKDDMMSIEILFIDDRCRGKGYGSTLIDFALKQGATKVDVNEQNASALNFYQAKGFRIIGRDETDEAGRPYPILHLSL